MAIKERLHGFIVSHNRDKRLGSIMANDGKKYFFFEGESANFDFNRRNVHRDRRPSAVTFTVWAAKKPGGDPLARDIESDGAYYEVKAKEMYGENYRTPEQRRAHKAAKLESELTEKYGAQYAKRELALTEKYGANYLTPEQRSVLMTSTVPVSH